VRNLGNHRRLVRSACGLRLLLTVYLAVHSAMAQSTDAAEPSKAQTQEHAQELFNEGLRLMQSDHCQDAVSFFLESQSNDPAAATLANLATCYARLGKTGSAYSTYKLAARAAILENKPELHKQTDHAATALVPQLTQLRVVPLGNGGLPNIKLNGQVVDDVRKPIPLDPGENIIEATAPGHETWRRIFSAQGGGTLLVVEVPDLSARHEPMMAQTSMGTASQPPDVSKKRTDLKPYALVAAGAGLVAIGVGTTLTFSALSKQNSANAYCDGRFCTQPGVDLRNQALDRAEFATWSVTFGIVSLGAAATLWLLSPKDHPEAHARAPSPWISVGHSTAVVGLEGRL
jgi:hypothetical protein